MPQIKLLVREKVGGSTGKRDAATGRQREREGEIQRHNRRAKETMRQRLRKERGCDQIRDRMQRRNERKMSEGFCLLFYL